MDFVVASKTLDVFEDIIYKINMELIEEIHKKFLSDLDFEELKAIVEGRKKKKFVINFKEN